jgi:hypothetical protein
MTPEDPGYWDAERRHLRVVDAHPELFTGHEPVVRVAQRPSLPPSPGPGRGHTRDVPDPDVTGAPILWAFISFLVAAAVLGWWVL